MSKFRVEHFFLIAFLCIGISLVFTAKNKDKPNDHRQANDNKTPEILQEETHSFDEKNSTPRFSEKKQETPGPNCEAGTHCVENSLDETHSENPPPVLSSNLKTDEGKASSDLPKTPSLEDPKDLESKIEGKQQKTTKEEQEKLLIALDGRYIGIVDITDQKHIDATKTSKLKCSINIDSSKILDGDVNSELLLYKSGESEPYFRLSFSGSSIYKELNLLNRSKFSIGSFELRHKFELIYSAETSTLSGKLFILSDLGREWKEIGMVSLVKTL